MSFGHGGWDDDEDDDDLGGIHGEEKIRLSRDLVIASRTMGSAEARYLVDLYYMTQEMRKRADNQVLSLKESTEPHVLIAFVSDKSFTMEKQIARALDQYTQNHMMGDWIRNIVGIGPVIAAGLLAHVYIGKWCAVCHGKDDRDCKRRQSDKKRKLEPHLFQPVESCPVVGHIWQFGGVAGDGQKKWEKGKRRPFNAEFKTLIWKAGVSFMRFHKKPTCYYGKIYEERKYYEIGRNESGALADRAAESLPHYRKDTDAYKWYVQGKLPPAHIDARARRYAVKMMLAHLHHEWWVRTHNGEPPPLPYPQAFLGHAHMRPPPPMPPK